MKKIIMKMLKKLFSSRKKAGIVVISMLLVSVVVWRALGSKKEAPQFQTAQVKRGTIISSVSASGQILTANITEVSSKASGLVEEVHVSDGETITKGQKLAKIELDIEGAQAYASAYANYISAVNSLKGAENNYRSTQATLEKVYDEIQGHDEDETFEMKETRTKAEVANDNAYDAIQTAKAKLSSSALDYQSSSPIITAPVSGTITALSFVEGMRIGAQETTAGTRTSQKVAVIESEGTPIASFNLSEIDIFQISVGQKATITLDSIADKTFTGKVVSVDRVGMITSGVTNYPVIIQFDTSSDQILPNMTATAEIITEAKENVLWIPSQAVRTQAGQTMVKVLVNGKPQEKQVEVELETSSQIEIVSGLSEGETIIVSEQMPSEEEPAFGGMGGFGGMMRPGGRR